VTAINTIHNLPLDDCKRAISEIQRVSKKHAFIVVDAWRNDEERERHEKWILTCETAMHVDDWKSLFDAIGYTGDYFWTFTE
jgi:ubiquinone/menaquinone biosynthesis C-methylase UbiE